MLVMPPDTEERPALPPRLPGVGRKASMEPVKVVLPKPPVSVAVGGGGGGSRLQVGLAPLLSSAW